MCIKILDRIKRSNEDRKTIKTNPKLQTNVKYSKVCLQ